MLARLLPQGDYSLITYELARMGHQAPDTLLDDSDRRLVCKFLAVPREAVSMLMHWLRQQGPGYWGYSTASADAGTLDLLCGGPATLVSRLRAEQQPVLQPFVVAVEEVLQPHEHAIAPLFLGHHGLP